MSRRAYSRMHATFWTSPTVRSLGDDGRTLAAYLLTGPHSNMLGCFRLPDAYVADDLGWGIERVAKGFDKLAAHGFAERDNESKWVFVSRYIYWNPAENPNQAKAMCRLWEDVPVERFRRVIAGILLGQTKLDSDQVKALGKGSETLSHSGDRDRDRDRTGDQEGAPDGASTFALETQVPEGKQKKPKPKPKGDRPDLDPSTLTPEEHAAYEALRDDPTLGPITLRPAEGARDLAKRFPSLDLAAAIIDVGATMRAKNRTHYKSGVGALLNWLPNSRCVRPPGARPLQPATNEAREPTQEENLARERAYSERILNSPDGEGIRW